MSETEHEPNEEQEAEPTPAPDPTEPTEDEEHEEHEEAQPAEPEPEGAAAPEPQEQEWDDFFKKAERSFGTYRRVVLSNYPGDEGDLIEVGISPSAPPGFLNRLDAGRVDEETKRPILEFFGFAREQDYEPDPQTRECSTCKGKGKTKTGSHVAGRETRPCPACNGSGAEGLTAGPPPVGANGQSDEPFTLAAPENEQAADADNWGEPRILPDGRENPNYGKQPQFKVLVEPYGRTAGLTAQDVAAGG